MPGVNVRGLAELDAKLDRLLKEFPEERRKLHEEIAQSIKKEVDTQISNTLNDSRGKVRSWQVSYVGSGGGYAAVRPKGGQIGGNSPGAITNYLEHGHKIRGPSGKSDRYRSRIKRIYVDGRHFYQRARRQVEVEAIKRAEALAERLAKRIEG